MDDKSKKSLVNFHLEIMEKFEMNSDEALEFMCKHINKGVDEKVKIKSGDEFEIKGMRFVIIGTKESTYAPMQIEATKIREVKCVGDGSGFDCPDPDCC